MPNEQLLADADALDGVADAADYLAGLASESDPAHAAKVKEEAGVLRRWADLCRAVGA